MSRRGHTLLLLIMVSAAVLAGAATVTARAGGIRSRHHDEDVRTQALWLGRSALTSGLSGERDVPTRLGVAHVVVTGDSVAVELAGMSATVGGAPYGERYQSPVAN